MTRLRSLLFAPGNDRRKLLKLPGTTADGVIADLEDAVAVDAKHAARTITAELIAQFPDERFTVVRVNGAPADWRADLEAVVCPALDAIMVPKVETAGDLFAVAEQLEELERARGLEVGAIRLLALVETAAGIARCESIAAEAPPRLLSLVFGPGDLALDLGVDFDDGAVTLTHARARLVIAARAAGLPAPVDGPYPWLDDPDGLRADSARSRTMGFGGRLLLHPKQIEPVHAAYSLLTARAAQRMTRAVAHFEDQRRQGVVSTVYEGEFLDPPVYERMRNLLLEHTSAGGRA